MGGRMFEYYGCTQVGSAMRWRRADFQLLPGAVSCLIGGDCLLRKINLGEKAQMLGLLTRKRKDRININRKSSSNSPLQDKPFFSNSRVANFPSPTIS
jgi:hypothetical protein